MVANQYPKFFLHLIAFREPYFNSGLAGVCHDGYGDPVNTVFALCIDKPTFRNPASKFIASLVSKRENKAMPPVPSYATPFNTCPLMGPSGS